MPTEAQFPVSRCVLRKLLVYTRLCLGCVGAGQKDRGCKLIRGCRAILPCYADPNCDGPIGETPRSVSTAA